MRLGTFEVCSFASDHNLELMMKTRGKSGFGWPQAHSRKQS